MGHLEFQQKKEVRYSRKQHKRFYTKLDMAIAKHDQAVRNSKIKRGEIKRGRTEYIADCGCGAEGCFLHLGFDSNPIKREIIEKKPKWEIWVEDKEKYKNWLEKYSKL